MSHLPYMILMPRAFMLVIVSASSGFVGVRGSTSTAAYASSVIAMIGGQVSSPKYDCTGRLSSTDRRTLLS